MRALFVGKNSLFKKGRSIFADRLSGFWEKLLWNIPGGGKRRADRIRNIVGEYGSGYIGLGDLGWSYAEIRENNLYEEVGWVILGSSSEFWGSIGRALCWPLKAPFLWLIVLPKKCSVE